MTEKKLKLDEDYTLVINMDFYLNEVRYSLLYSNYKYPIEDAVLNIKDISDPVSEETVVDCDMKYVVEETRHEQTVEYMQGVAEKHKKSIQIFNDIAA